MKTIMIKLSILAVACFLATAVNAQFSGVPNNHMQVRLSTCEHPAQIQIRLYNLMNLQTTITLVNVEGKIYYRKEVDDLAAWSEKFQFESTIDGIYFFVVKQTGIEKSLKFRIKNRKVMPPEREEVIAFQARLNFSKE
jgi:hypothetical protein